MLDIDELLELEEILRTEIDENLEHILVKLNATGKLKDLLSLLDMGKYLETDEDNMVIRDGKLIVIGQSEVGKEQLIGVAANSHFLRTAGPHFPDSPGHIKRTACDISRAEVSPPY